MPKNGAYRPPSAQIGDSNQKHMCGTPAMSYTVIGRPLPLEWAKLRSPSPSIAHVASIPFSLIVRTRPSDAAAIALGFLSGSAP